MKKLTYIFAAFIISLTYSGIATYAATSVQNVKIQQRYPWNGLVDIDYEIVSDSPTETDFYIYFIAKDNDLNRSIAPRSLSGSGVPGTPVKKGVHRITWDMGADIPGIHSSALSVSVHASTAMPYLVIDLSGGPGATSYPVRYSTIPPNVDNDTCRTTELWLKFIQPGTFLMGSPTDEISRNNDELLHQVTLTTPYYLGIFEITQKQWSLVMGSNPSGNKGDTRPVEKVSYNAIRGSVNGSAWPINGQVDADSFTGKLRSKTPVVIDIPTESQWEYACRAGTTSSLGSGKAATDDNIREIGRCSSNQDDGKGGYTSGHTKVGSYLPNAWGIYDMHGNVHEWCLDLFGNYPSGPSIDPVGDSTGSARAYRGGAWCHSVKFCRSASRVLTGGGTYNESASAVRDYIGFRIAALPVIR